MGFEVTFTGVDQLGQVARRLKTVGDKGLGKQMSKGLLDAAAAVRPRIRASALASMPSGYGPVLSRSLRFRQQTRTGATAAQVVLRTSAQGQRQPRHIDALERGRLRHPRWGDRRHWYGQAVTPRFINRPVDALRPQIARAMNQVVDQVAAQLGA